MRRFSRTARTFISALLLSIIFVNLYLCVRKPDNIKGKKIRVMASEYQVVLLGTQLEGGGGLIRDGLTYSTLLNKPMKITSIRANRPGVGGLRVEHTVAIGTMSRLSGAIVKGNETASRELIFEPHQLSMAGEIDSRKPLDVTMEGSAAILMIAIMPYILFSGLGKAAHSHPTIPREGVAITIRAGTLCIKAPSYHNLQHVLLPTLKLIGIGEEHVRLSPDYDQGWHTDFVKVPGRIKLWIKPLQRPLKAFTLNHRGKLARIRITAHAPGNEFVHFGAVVRREIEESLRAKGLGVAIDVDIDVETIQSTVSGQYHLLLVGETVSPTAYIGHEQVFPQTSGFPENLEADKEKLYTHLARVCLHGLINELKSGDAIDENLQDMMAVYQSLADGFSSVTAPGNEKLVRDSAELAVPLSKSSRDIEVSQIAEQVRIA